MIKLAEKTFYITTAIDYTNAAPHIGHAYQKIASDVQARWKRSQGYDVFFLTGTDEHGLKIQRAAKEKGVSPQDFVDKLSKQFQNAWDKLNIRYDKFIRTTDKDHKKAVKEAIKKIKEKGDIYKSQYKGLYCVGCERFLTEKDLIDGRCPDHKTKPEYIKEESYFFKLSKYQKPLLKFYKENPEFISPKLIRKHVINRVKE
ncbi:class I tRNA ligase family protein, partial [Candidatus Woesearchaeota archaeon]|nr:class I tRNA ligase family protein [Candidatus Woesearchaeota archaeon]